jgi:hypothetical protein
MYSSTVHVVGRCGHLCTLVMVWSWQRPIFLSGLMWSARMVTPSVGPRPSGWRRIRNIRDRSGSGWSRIFPIRRVRMVSDKTHHNWMKTKFQLDEN